MPRKRRVLANCGIYHVILKGMGSQLLFEDDKDKKRFLSTLYRFEKEQCFEIYAYCLLDNHVHLLLWDQPNSLSLIMKKINLSYVLYFNKKYERTGSLFHGRFKSELIDNDFYLLSTFRYIHNNPQKAGIANKENYRWSSYLNYLKKKSDKFMNLSFILEMIKDNYGAIPFSRFSALTENSVIMDIDSSHYINDRRVISQINQKLKINSPQKIQSLSKIERNKALKELISLQIPLRQLERVLGISRGIIKRSMRV